MGDYVNGEQPMLLAPGARPIDPDAGERCWAVAAFLELNDHPASTADCTPERYHSTSIPIYRRLPPRRQTACLRLRTLTASRRPAPAAGPPRAAGPCSCRTRA